MGVPASGTQSGSKARAPNRLRAVAGRHPNRRGQSEHESPIVQKRTALVLPLEQSRHFWRMALIGGRIFTMRSPQNRVPLQGQ